MAERFFILTPTPIDQVATPDSPATYLDADGKPMKWSGKIPCPAIGDRIYLSVNSIGYGKVVGFAECEGWLGILADPEDPPDWWKRQRDNTRKEHKLAQKLGPDKAKIERVRTYPQWVLDGTCCVFGAEIRREK